MTAQLKALTLPPRGNLHTVVFNETKRLIQEDGDIHACAARAGVAPSTLNNWLADRVNAPNLATLVKVLRALGYQLIIKEI